jgi:hypothetical protein
MVRDFRLKPDFLLGYSARACTTSVACGIGLLVDWRGF